MIATGKQIKDYCKSVGRGEPSPTKLRTFGSLKFSIFAFGLTNPNRGLVPLGLRHLRDTGMHFSSSL